MHPSIHVCNQGVFVSRQMLSTCEISTVLHRKWKERLPNQWITIGKQKYINYDAIPEGTRSKLPEKYQLIYDAEQETEQKSVNWWHQQMQQASESKDVARYRSEILEMNLPVSIEKIVVFAKKAAVFQCIAENYSGAKGELTSLHKAYLKLYPGGYSNASRLLMTVSAAKKEGVLSVAIDKRYMSGRKKEFGSNIEYWSAAVLSSGKKYNISEAHRQLSEICAAKQCNPPGLSWVRKFARRGEIANSIREQRNGASTYQNMLPKATIIPAEHTGDQWAMDGWTLPVYCKRYDEKERKIKYFATYTLFTVIDVHSRKVLASMVAESENTECILSTLEQAVRNTGILPFEIVADNHSFNRTTEAESIKEHFEKIGVRWTVDSNPRRKAILERMFKTLGVHLKPLYGYKGQGIRTRDPNGLTSPELMEEYTKRDTFLTKDQLCVMVAYVAERYNNTVIKKLDATPNELYRENDMPNAFKIDAFQRMKLFVREGVYKVPAGQITIERSGNRYEFVLPAEHIHRFNWQKVIVRYESFDEVYVYDMSDAPVCCVKQKVRIHGALANQTDEDIKNLNKLKGKIAGVKNEAKKTRRQLYDDAIEVDNGASEALSYRNASKDLIAAVMQDANMQKRAADMGVNIYEVAPFPQNNEIKEKIFKPVDKDRSPFYRKGTLRKLDMEEEAKK